MGHNGPPERAANAITGRLQVAKQRAGEEAGSYAEKAPDERPLSGYLELLGLYFLLVGFGAGAVKASEAELPEQVPSRDLILLAIATHKLSRILTKDPVTSPFRAPFTRFEKPAGEGEIIEAPRGRGFRHAFGELLTCPFCIGQWVATVLTVGLVIAPRLTRLVAGVFVVLTGSDFMQFVYAAARRSEQD